MKSFRAAGWAALSIVAVLALASFPATAQGSSPALSLVYEQGPLFLTNAGLALAAGTTGPCTVAGASVTPQSSGAQTASFKFTPLFPTPLATNASGTPTGTGHYRFRDSISFALKFTAPAPTPPQPQAPSSTSGFSVVGVLKTAKTSLTSAAVAVGMAQPGAQISGATLVFPFADNSTFVNHDGGDVTLSVTMTVTQPAQGVTPPNNNFAIECGTSKTESLKLTRGDYTAAGVAEGDLDADGLPDGLDLDRDNDNVPNSQEAFICTVSGSSVSAADNAEIQPSPHNSDGDRTSDEEECKTKIAGTNPQQSYDPLSAASFPPAPTTFMDDYGSYIFLLIALLLVALAIWLFLKFGKAVSVTILSQAELFIPPGQKGKYEIAVQNLAKKGEARTFQLLVQGMPEGWDAKLNVDHVTLMPQGNEQSRGVVWLEVEAPTHTDPESAVVTVKAVALNKAGRKDSLKLPGKAETITSINVPAGSKVPIKRGGKIAAAEPTVEAPAAGGSDVGVGDADSRPAIHIEGVGEVYSQKLEKAGIKTVGELRRADAAMLAKKTGANETTVRQWQAMGDLMNLEGVGPQFAEQLVRAGILSIPQLAQEKPKPLVEKIEKTNAARETPIQGAGIQEKQAKNFIKAAEKFVKANPSAVPAAAPAVATPAATSAPAAAPAPAPAAKPNLQVGGLKHEPPSFRQGETVKSSVSVANNGGEASTIKLSLFVNDGLADVQTVTVKAGKAKDVQFKWTAQEKNKLNIKGELVAG